MFEIEFDLFENLIKKAQKKFEDYLQNNPLSKRGLEAEIGLENQLLLNWEYLRQYIAQVWMIVCGLVNLNL